MTDRFLLLNLKLILEEIGTLVVEQSAVSYSEFATYSKKYNS